MFGLAPLPAVVIVCILAAFAVLVALVTILLLRSEVRIEWKGYRLAGGIAAFVALYPLFLTAYFKMYVPLDYISVEAIEGSWAAYQFGVESFSGIWTFARRHGGGAYDVTLTMSSLTPSPSYDTTTHVIKDLRFDGRVIELPRDATFAGSLNVALGLVGTFSDARGPGEQLNTGTLMGYQTAARTKGSLRNALYSLLPVSAMIVAGVVMTLLLFGVLRSEAVRPERKVYMVGAIAGFCVIWSVLSSGFFLLMRPGLLLWTDDVRGSWIVENASESEKYANWEFFEEAGGMTMRGDVFQRARSGALSLVGSFPPVYDVRFNGDEFDFKYRSQFGDGRCSLRFQQVLVGRLSAYPWNRRGRVHDNDTVILFRFR